jgi:hypothetical protein
MLLKKKLLLFLLLMMITTLSSQAQKPMSDEWEFKVAPFLWTLQINAENSVGVVTVPLELEFSEIWDNLRFGGSLHYEMAKNEWSIIADMAYFDIYRENIVIETEGPQTPVANLDFTVWQGELLGAYRFGDAKETSYFEGLLGVRYTRQKVDLSVELFQNSPEGGFDESWVDPIIGGRYTASFTPQFYGVFRGDIGGFGIGSQFTWNVGAQMGYKFTDLFGLVLGYKYLDVNYNTGTEGTADYFAFDGSQQGIILGALFTW